MSILGSTEAIAIDFWQLQGQRVREGATRRAKEAVWQVVGKKREERERDIKEVIVYSLLGTVRGSIIRKR